MVVNDGSLDILPDYFTLPDCCPLCCRPSDSQFADYLQFPDDSLNPEPRASSSSSSASWTPPQPEFEFNDVSDLNNVFFGFEFPHSNAQYEPDLLQLSGSNLSGIADGLLPDCTRAPSLSTTHQAFEFSKTGYSSMTDGSLAGEPNSEVGIWETGVLRLNGLDDFPITPNPTSSNTSSLCYEPAQEGEVESAISTATLETQKPETFLSDAEEVAQPPSQSGQFICGWRECQTPFSRMADLRLHVRSHTKGAGRCLWDGCRRLPEPVSALNKHLDSHTKPHLCPEADCGHRAAKLRDMKRHVLKHRITRGAKVFYCPASDCQHNEGRTPFLRGDNARRHMRSMHSGLTSDIIIGTYNK